MKRVRLFLICCLSIAWLGSWMIGCSPTTPPVSEKGPVDSGSQQADRAATDTNASSCKSDADCKDPTKPVCQAGVCVKSPKSGCQSDKDCTDPTKPKCTNGVCEAIPPECSTNQDCPRNKPVCTKGVCGPCTGNVDCVNPEFPLCQNGECAKANPPPACKTDADCKANETCQAGKCVTTPPPGCKTNADCKANETCQAGKCVTAPPPGCKTDADCKDNETCQAGKCVTAPPPGCKADTDCKDPSKPVCKNGTCVAKSGCSSDADCKATPATPYCDATAKVCRTCLNDKQCKANEYCDSSKFVCAVKQSCSKATDCKLGFLCTNGTCIEGCQSKRDCPTDKAICHPTKKKCVACEKDSDCNGNDTCDTATNQCIFKCSRVNNIDSNCYRRDATKRYCEGTTFQCVACLNYRPSSAYRFDLGCNNQNPICNTKTRKCVPCAADKDCVPGSNALSSKCDTKNNTCYECSKTSDCRRGAICNTSTKKCIKGCLTTNDCPRGKICGDYNQCVDCSSKSPTCAPGLVCNVKLNSCVECVKDTDCKSGSKCDTSLNRCLASTGRSQCLPCTKTGSQGECATGHTCIKAPLGFSSGGTTARTENVCLKKCASDTDCAQGYTCCSRTNGRCNTRSLPALAGHCYPRYSTGGSQTEGYIAYRSCKAVFTQGNPCSVSGRAATCGHGAQSSSNFASGDSLCDATQKICRLACQTNTDCVKGYSCKCPSGYTLRGFYCYNTNNQYALRRCVK